MIYIEQGEPLQPSGISEYDLQPSEHSRGIFTEYDLQPSEHSWGISEYDLQP